MNGAIAKLREAKALQLQLDSGGTGSAGSAGAGAGAGAGADNATSGTSAAAAAASGAGAGAGSASASVADLSDGGSVGVSANAASGELRVNDDVEGTGAQQQPATALAAEHAATGAHMGLKRAPRTRG
eukprot:4662151-Pleurochrysis_carterae.AAC.1